MSKQKGRNQKYDDMSGSKKFTPWLKASYSIFKGSVRENQEDRYIVDKFEVEDSKLNGKYYLFVILDGHGGDEVAEYAKKKLKSILKSNLFESLDIKQALEKTFKKVNDNVSKNYESGSTMSIILIRDHENKKEIYSANVGDSSIYAANTSTKDIRKISWDHSTDLKSEKQRLEKHPELNIAEDGYVVHKQESLAMTRALGDASFQDGISAKPTIQQIHKKYDMFILATDGIWDVVTSHKILEEINKYRSKINWKNMAKEILKWRNSEFEQHDNTSMIIVDIECCDRGSGNGMKEKPVKVKSIPEKPEIEKSKTPKKLSKKIRDKKNLSKKLNHLQKEVKELKNKMKNL